MPVHMNEVNATYCHLIFTCYDGDLIISEPKVLIGLVGDGSKGHPRNILMESEECKHHQHVKATWVHPAFLGILIRLRIRWWWRLYAIAWSP